MPSFGQILQASKSSAPPSPGDRVRISGIGDNFPRAREFDGLTGVAERPADPADPNGMWVVKLDANEGRWSVLIFPDEMEPE